jgi:TldD protein
MNELHLPTAMAELRPSLPGLVEEAEQKAPYFAALLSSRRAMRIFADNNEEQVDEVFFPPTAGTVLSIFDGKTIYERALAGFSKKEITKAAEELIATTNFDKTYKPEAQPKRRGDFTNEAKLDPVSMPVKEKLERVRNLQKRARGLDPRIVNARVVYIEMNEQSVFNNRWADMAQRVTRVRLQLMLFVSGSDGQIRYDWTSKAGTGGWELLEFTDEEIQAVANTALALLSAKRIEPGEYQIVSAPGVTGTICHESFGHGVETDMFLKERAKAAHFIDQTVGSDLVNIYDDPSLPGIWGSYFFDDEGQLSTSTQIVEDGIFRRGITDFYSATALKTDRSANGRRQDFSRKAYARMSNTFFGAGKSNLSDMIAQVDHGIYLDKWSSGMEDPQGWGIQVTCHYGHEIMGGKITDKVFSPVVISGYVPKVLQSVTAVSNDFLLDAGFCGKGSKEYVPVSSGGPHLLLRAPLG